MRLAVFAVLRNEADIAPAFLAHLGALFDHALLMDHGSSDGTAVLLAAACASRPGWRHWTVALAGNHQQAVANFAWRWLIEHTDADVIIPLDADEFIDVPDRTALEVRLACLEPGEAGQFRWRNCVPVEPANPLTYTTPLLAADTPSPFPKVVIPRALALAVPDLQLGKGAHVLRSAAGSIPTRELGTLLHVPIRSEAQFRRKVIDGVLCNLCRPDRPAGQSAHMAAMLQPIAAGTLDHAVLRQLGLRYAEPPDPAATGSARRLDVAHLPMETAKPGHWDADAIIARTLSRWQAEEVGELELSDTTLSRKHLLNHRQLASRET